MKVTNVILDNFQSYSHEELAFDEGVSLFHGDNGAGKSTILRAIFAGLFQTQMSHHAASGFDSIGELVKKNEKEGRVVLTFDVGGDEYTLTWEISVDDPDAEEPTGKTKECVLEGPGEGFPIDGVTAVRTAIQEELIGMDARAFTSSVYIQQDEVMRLITADDGERREIFDDLLGLSKLDTYIERTVSLRREAKAKRDEASNRRDELQNQLDEEYPDRSDLQSRQQELGRDLSDAEDTRDELQETVSELKSERDALQTRIDNYGDLEDEQEELETAIADLSEEITETEAHIDELDEAIETHRQEMWTARGEVSDLDETIEDYDVSTADAASDAEEQANEAHLDASRAETEAQQALKTAESNLQDARQTADDLSDDIRTLEAQESEREAHVDAAEEAVAEAEATLQETREARDAVVRDFLPDENVPADITQETRTRVEARIETLNDQREEAGNEATRLRAERDGTEREVSRLETEIESTEAEREDALDALPQDVRESDNDGEGSIVEDRLTEAQEAANDIETFTTPQVTPETLETLRDRVLPEMQSDLNTDYAENIEMVVELSAREQTLNERLDEFDTINSEGECPVCGENVADDNTHHTDERERIEAELADLQPVLDGVRTERDRLEADRETIAHVRGLVSEAILVRSLAEYDEELDALQSEKTSAKETVESLTEAIEDAEAQERELQEHITDARENVLGAFDDVETAKQAVTETEAELETAEGELDAVRDDIESLESERDEVGDRIDSLAEETTEATNALAEANEAVTTAKETLTTVKEAVELHDEYEHHEQAIETKEREKENKRQVIDSLRDRRGEKQARLQEVEQELASADLSDLQDEYDAVDADLTDAKESLTEARETVDSLNGAIAKVENRIEAYDKLAARVSDLDDQMSWAQGIVDEMNDLITTYESIKATLRTENITLINAYANDIFRELYHSSSYERIILNDDYTISLVKSDGSRISPRLSSGGESAIINIALRAGVYRTIAERNQTASSGLPPFILDEPTTFLDDGHVRELESVIDSIKTWDVAQVLIVSHDESLIDAADFEYKVTKDSTTDTSSCTRRNATAGGI